MAPVRGRGQKLTLLRGQGADHIAKGSGVAIGEVSQLVTNFFEGQKQMRAMFAGGIPGMPPAMGAMARRAATKSARGKKGKKKPARSGDPRRAGEIVRGSGAQGQDNQRQDNQRQDNQGGGAPASAEADWEPAWAACPKASRRASPTAWPTCRPA